ncbi:hypothetical protein LCGC14_2419180 [marine sediment metagenome]|uniref:Uncharacterized protein n=1 Tax=marine sediment metagenome TaxID=412755 RepID=A0A0F9EJI2_9ZZZZ
MNSKWHYTIWTPHNEIGEVLGLFNEAGQNQAFILGGPDGITTKHIERARFIIRAVNNFDDLLAALENSTTLLQRVMGEVVYLNHRELVQGIELYVLEARAVIETAKKEN